MINTMQHFKLRKFIAGMKKYRARHTELISVYIPVEYDMNKIIQHLFDEQGTASNIKDKTTRKNVQDALEKMIRHLRIYKNTPEHGLAAFSGNVSDHEGKQDIQVWSIEPPVPVNIRLYRCDQTFVIEPLEGMIVTDEVYGLIVLDNREAAIGLLKGKSVQTIRSFTSAVPGKVKVGGWCLDPETLVCCSDGRIIPIKEINKNENIKSFGLNINEIENSKVLGSSLTKHNKILRIITGYPRLEIDSSHNHTFFIFYKSKIKEKTASELEVGDCLLMPEKIDFSGEIQKFSFKGNSSTKLPIILTEDLARFVGYLIGDGSYDKDDRIELVDERKMVAEYYVNLIYNLFGKKVSFRYRGDKNYYEVRINSRNIVRFIKNEFPEKKHCEDSLVPTKIMLSKDEVIVSFLRGIFDAEGYVDEDEVAIAMKNKPLVNQIRILLLRFSIIGSFCYSGRGRWAVRITDKDSLINFKNKVNFIAPDKTKRLSNLILFRTDRNNIRQIAYSGSWIRSILKNFGYIKNDFKTVSNFFYDQRGMSKVVFVRTFLNKVKNKAELYENLKKVVDFPLIPIKIKKIKEVKCNKTLVDISVTNKNFFANGILVHNSQQRYSRLREEAANEFYKRIADVANVEFENVGKDLKGILVGGPGPTKNTFVDKDHLHSELKKKIIAVEDITYTDEQGLHELVEKAQHAISESEIAKEKKILNEFFTLLATNSDKVLYGLRDVKKALEYGAVEKVLLSDALEEIEELEEKAHAIGSQVFLISTETKEGVQLRDLGGVGAILRYAIEV